jgi:hypothetical protein
MICELCNIKDFIVHWVLPLLFGLRNFETIQYALCHRKFSYMINQKFMKLCTLQDPNMKMCPSSFPRIMSLKVVFQICFGSINKKFSVGYLIIPSWKYFEKKKIINRLYVLLFDHGQDKIKLHIFKSIYFMSNYDIKHTRI